MDSRKKGIDRKLCCMVFDDPQEVVMGKEPIWRGDRLLGYVTSADQGYTVGESIVYGYLPVDDSVLGNAVEIEYFGDRLRARVVSEPRFDPDGLRMRS